MDGQNHRMSTVGVSFDAQLAGPPPKTPMTHPMVGFPFTRPQKGFPDKRQW